MDIGGHAAGRKTVAHQGEAVREGSRGDVPFRLPSGPSFSLPAQGPFSFQHPSHLFQPQLLQLLADGNTLLGPTSQVEYLSVGLAFEKGGAG